MKKKTKLRIFKISLLIITIIILTIITVYLFPVMKNLSSKEGQIAFKQKVTNSGDDARKWAKSYKKLQESYRIVFDNFLIHWWLQKLQRLQGFFKISRMKFYFSVTTNWFTVLYISTYKISPPWWRWTCRCMFQPQYS